MDESLSKEERSSCGAYSHNEIVSLAKITVLEVDNIDIDELVEEHIQELTNKELTELHCVPQIEVMEESVREGGNSKATIFWRNMRNTESAGNSFIEH
ncbi:hypothetical protein AVEN_93239-1 [Araneus ventricosus]|uniref:Uncharacterized protein n=1 Tax=Araneus ventricosus TaxID=182803 RepID=A0A4Y2TBR9_ARAVE|nr:hypothetical protein AVEN_93239-1 [Araneus ventricosus]